MQEPSVTTSLKRTSPTATAAVGAEQIGENKYKTKQTPLMQQYWSIKELHSDKILFFRMGDFYELFYDDALKAAPILGVTLTSRNKKSEDETPMCGMPHFSLPQYVNKLLKLGFKVAICDQIEDPKQAKGIVKRAVTRILTPGMIYDPDNADSKDTHYLAAFNERTFAVVDSTTGDAFSFDLQQGAEGWEKLCRQLLISLNPKEVISSEALLNLFKSELDDLGSCRTQHNISDDDSIEKVLINYLKDMQGEATVQVLKPFEKRSLIKQFYFPIQTLQHLEIFKSTSGGYEGSLMWALDRTSTSGGARLLKNQLRFPTTDLEKLNERFDRIDFWLKHPERISEIRSELRNVGDLERRLNKLGYPQVSARDLISLSQILIRIEMLRPSLISWTDQSVPGYTEILNLAKKIEEAIRSDCPLSTTQGGIFKQGFSLELDELIALTDDSEGQILEIEKKERERTGIGSLKVRYSQVFGYAIEVTNTHLSKIPAHYKRKQTLAQAERFVTDELQELERKLDHAQVRRWALEKKMFEDWLEKTRSVGIKILGLADQLNQLDLDLTMAWLSLERRYHRPQFIKNKNLKLSAQRHPVVELKSGFVPNSIDLKQGGCFLVTGPNMAGKSTFLRQVALTVWMAQCGLFVPVDLAELPLFHSLFTRIGANDAVWEGESTFMVEMKEAAEICRNCDENSLVILDEIGRGTSTYDGMSLAQSLLEFLVAEKKATVLFSTHYHELTQLSQSFEQIRNVHMAIQESAKGLRFLYSIVDGGSEKSYGLHVAQLAGVPIPVVQRAAELLQCREKSEGPSFQVSQKTIEVPFQLNLFDQKTEFLKVLVDDLVKLDVNKLTPIQALVALQEIQEKFKKPNLF